MAVEFWYELFIAMRFARKQSAFGRSIKRDRDQATRSREPHDQTRWLLEPAVVNAKIPH